MKPSERIKEIALEIYSEKRRISSDVVSEVVSEEFDEMWKDPDKIERSVLFDRAVERYLDEQHEESQELSAELFEELKVREQQIAEGEAPSTKQMMEKAKGAYTLCLICKSWVYGDEPSKKCHNCGASNPGDLFIITNEEAENKHSKVTTFTDTSAGGPELETVEPKEGINLGINRRDALKRRWKVQKEQPLKTLKDLPAWNCDPPLEMNAIEIKDLRAEAIHRAKTKIGYLMNNRAVKKFWFNKGSPMIVVDTLQETALMYLAWTIFGEIQEIINFNNLTEDDLK